MAIKTGVVYHRSQFEVVACNPFDEWEWSYNAEVATRLLNRLQEHKARKQSLPIVVRREAAGVLIIALLILAFTLARYWHNIAWSAR